MYIFLFFKRNFKYHPLVTRAISSSKKSIINRKYYEASRTSFKLAAGVVAQFEYFVARIS